jgi:hypothetical protein
LQRKLLQEFYSRYSKRKHKKGTVVVGNGTKTQCENWRFCSYGKYAGTELKPKEKII